MNEAREKQTFDVFLSHNSKNKPGVRALAALLSERGITVWFDEDQLIPGRRWQPLMEEGIKQSRTGAVLIGTDGLGPWEDVEMQVFLQAAVCENKPIIPVLLPGAPEQPQLPSFLSLHMWVDLRAGFDTEGMDRLIWGITGKHPVRKPIPPWASEPIISVTRLHHGAEHLVGREKEVTRLDTVWHDPETHIVSIVAWGGVGKTALVVEWMARMARDGWRGGERVFDWSFYSQGTREQGAASADSFIAAALEFFGGKEGKDLAGSPMSGWDKGAKLAQLVARRPTLLVLDGLEPLQYPPGPVGGKLKDPALEALLKGLAQHNTGLCLITTREPVADLAPFCDTVSPEWHLDRLSVDAGADLLFQMGVKRAGSAAIKADDEELRSTAREVGGHALTLQLLGRYLAKVHNGDVRRRSLVAFHRADAKTEGGHAFRALAAYEKWLGDAGEEGQRQLAVLHLLGLFDRPADDGCLAALRRRPAIVGLTEPLVGLDDDDWNFTLSNLVECGFITCREEQSAIDSHPLVREYFAKQLRERNPDAWRAAHRRLYEHLCETAPECTKVSVQNLLPRPFGMGGGKDRPQPTLGDLQPLYQAVAHGCQAGLQPEAYEKVYFARIKRRNENYSSAQLGAFGSDLGAVASFFEAPWNRVSPVLTELDQASLRDEAAFCLRALGRLPEAIEPIRAGLDNCIKQENWLYAANLGSNLSALELTLGAVARAMEDTEHVVTYADRSGDAFMRGVARSGHADVLYQAGHRPLAEARFREAEKLQAEDQPQYPLLYSLRGFQYCDFLLGEAERRAWRSWLNPKSENWGLELFESYHAVRQRAAQILEWDAPFGRPLDWGLHHLTLGRAALYWAVLEESTSRSIESEIDEAVAGLRRSGHMDYIPRGLLTRAWARNLQRDAAGARADLDEAWEIAERGSMKLHMADIHLYRAKVFGPRKDGLAYPWGSPEADLAAARKLIEHCGYHRRDEELADAEEAAKRW